VFGAHLTEAQRSNGGFFYRGQVRQQLLEFSHPVAAHERDKLALLVRSVAHTGVHRVQVDGGVPVSVSFLFPVEDGGHEVYVGDVVARPHLSAAADKGKHVPQGPPQGVEAQRFKFVSGRVGGDEFKPTS